MSKNKRNFKKVLAAICAFSGTFGGNSDASDASKNKNTATVKTDVKSKNLSLNRQSGNKNFFEKTRDLIKANPIKSSLIIASVVTGVGAGVAVPVAIAKSKGKEDEKSGNPGDGGIKNEKDNLENQEQSQEIKEDSQNQNQGDGEQNQEQSQGENQGEKQEEKQEENQEKNQGENQGKIILEEDEEENEKIVIHDHEKFWDNLKFKSNIGDLYDMFKNCGERNIDNNFGSDKKVLNLFKNLNNVKKFMICKEIYAFITKKDNLADEKQNLESHINFSIPDYAIVCVKGEVKNKTKNKIKTEWNFYDGFDCKLDKDLNVLISEKNDD